MDNKKKLVCALLIGTLGISLIGVIFNSFSFSLPILHEKEECDKDEIDFGFYNFERSHDCCGNEHYRVFPSYSDIYNHKDTIDCQDESVTIELTSWLDNDFRCNYQSDIYASENSFLSLFGIEEVKHQDNSNVILITIKNRNELWTTIILPEEIEGKKQCIVSLLEKKVMLYNLDGNLEIERYMLYEWQKFTITEIKNSTSHEVVFKTADGRQLRLPIRKIKTVEDIESDNREYIEYNVSFEGSDRQKLIIHEHKSDSKYDNLSFDKNFDKIVFIVVGIIIVLLFLGKISDIEYR